MDKTASRLYTIFFGLVVLTISSIYQIPDGIRINLLLYPQIGVFAILGFFHAFNMMRFKNWKHNNENEIHAYEILDLISDFLLYTAWYNVVLFPLSGFGVIEWICVFLILISGFISDLAGTAFDNSKAGKTMNFLGQSPLTLLLTGTALYLLKVVVFYLLPSNIYLEAVQGNFLARAMLVFFCLIGILCLLSLLIKNVKSNLIKNAGISEEKINQAGKAAVKGLKGFFKLVWKGIKRFFKFLAKVCSSTVFIIVILIAVFMVVLIACAFALRIYNNILNFIGPFMENLLKTGKAIIIPSKLYGVCQTISLIAILFSASLTAIKLNRPKLS